MAQTDDKSAEIKSASKDYYADKGDANKRMESPSEVKSPDASSGRLARGKAAVAAAAAYVRECEADAAAKFSNKGGGKDRKGY